MLSWISSTSVLGGLAELLSMGADYNTAQTASRATTAATACYTTAAGSKTLVHQIHGAFQPSGGQTLTQLDIVLTGECLTSTGIGEWAEGAYAVQGALELVLRLRYLFMTQDLSSSFTVVTGGKHLCGLASLTLLHSCDQIIT